MDKKLGLDIEDEIIYAALPYFEIRHLIVHSEGKTDKKICEKFPHIEAEENKTIVLHYDLIQNIRTAITTLIKAFDKKVVDRNLVNENMLQS